MAALCFGAIKYGNFPNIPTVLEKAAVFIAQSWRTRELLIRKRIDVDRIRMIKGFWDGPLGLDTNLYRPMEPSGGIRFDKPLKDFI